MPSDTENIFPQVGQFPCMNMVAFSLKALRIEWCMTLPAAYVLRLPDVIDTLSHFLNYPTDYSIACLKMRCHYPSAVYLRGVTCECHLISAG